MNKTVKIVSVLIIIAVLLSATYYVYNAKRPSTKLTLTPTSAPTGAPTPAVTVTSYTIATSADSNSWITPLGSNQYAAGSDVDITYGANSGYYVSQVIVNGLSVDISGYVDLTNLMMNETISISSSPLS